MARPEPMDEGTRAVIDRLRRQIEYREAELQTLHEDYLSLEQRCRGLLAAIRRQAARDRLERANRLAAEAAND